ncbi:hypothetical protein EV426DRAFT_586154 [Tirmania nivea]|nr:hypothetical protein EV426DRAFT_586154 [Tirmania nivea]
MRWGISFLLCAGLRVARDNALMEPFISQDSRRTSRPGLPCIHSPWSFTFFSHLLGSSISSQFPHLRPISSPQGQTRATCLPVSTCLLHDRHVGSTVLYKTGKRIMTGIRIRFLGTAYLGVRIDISVNSTPIATKLCVVHLESPEMLL